MKGLGLHGGINTKVNGGMKSGFMFGRRRGRLCLVVQNCGECQIGGKLEGLFSFSLKKVWCKKSRARYSRCFACYSGQLKLPGAGSGCLL